MDLLTLFVLALGLSMDAFAVSVSNSMAYTGLRRGEAALTSFSFGVFQGLMPVIGYFAGRAFAGVVSAFDHWIAFVLMPCGKCARRNRPPRPMRSACA